MADLSDVTAFLAQAAVTAVYPNGSSQPSVAAMDCRVYEGWPSPELLDLDMAGNTGSPPTPRAGGRVANVSVYPMQGTGVTIPQILDKTYTIAAPVYGMSIAQNGNTITVTGHPLVGEYLSLIADNAHVYSSSGATTAALLAALATAAQVDYPTAASTPTTLTIPAGRLLVARQGAAGTLGKVTHRQRHEIMVTVWAPTRVVRNQLAQAIDVLIKKSNRVSMPDTSQALVFYSRTSETDEQQATTIYRRDLIYSVEYATLETFPGYVITTVNTTIASATGNASATALT